ncbi:MAG TPA: bifunctional UDP-N-acetylglucosamine diphosphorylase/glucosamine-1-phosphate N-acetyltransferase GlmU [Fervidobacterium sp.]|nr:bifunctional UDP-N-acetylglucosamine diphosphorylase/glucosamine-1-phosphate N-acetyltransferase GlmU [Fervidobacterium sp.]
MKVLILAAGLGKRMKSKYPKVIHKILGKPMINWVVDLGKDFGEVGAVVGHKAEIVKRYLPEDVSVYIQEPQLGTGHAVMCAKDFICPDQDLLVLYGDVPLLKKETIERLVRVHQENEYDVTVLTFVPENPSGYGRIVRHDTNIKIVEDKDTNEEQKKIREVNSGIYIFSGKFLLENIEKISNNNAQKEYYLTDVVAFSQHAGTVLLEDPIEVSGVNDRIQLAQLESIARQRILESLMLSGVTIVDPESTFIGPDVEIEMDSIIHPFTIIEGRTIIGQDCDIGPYSHIVESKIGDNVKVVRSEVEMATIEDNVSVGPYSRLREGTVLKEHVKIGNFVETKKSIIGSRSKAQHLTYLGDATVGNDVNVGAGTITCNYDGRNKYPTFIDDNAFIGSNSSLVAPVKIGKGAIVGAGSVITKDVPEDSLALGRAMQVNKEGWAKIKREAMDNANSKK